MSGIFYCECIVALISLYEAAWSMGTGKVVKAVVFCTILFAMALLMAPELNSVLSSMA